MSESATAIERRSQAEVILGGGDMAQMIEATKRNVSAAIEFARERSFVTEFPVERQGKVIGTRLFFHHPTWQLLSQSFGITAMTAGEPVEIKPGVWQARAEAYPVGASKDTVPVGAAVALCSRTEPGKKFKSDHDLSATAQTRAQRNALRSALGAILIAAGFEIADPEGPATKEQVGLLWNLARQLDLDEDAAHERAGVEHFRNLTREQASDMIEAWQTELESSGARAPDQSAAPVKAAGAADDPGHTPPGAVDTHEDDQPATDEDFARAERHHLTRASILRKAKDRWGVTRLTDVSRRMVADLIEEQVSR